MSTPPDRTFYGSGNPIMEAMFCGFIQFAWGQKEYREAFEAETGMTCATGGLAAMIDEATGFRGAYTEAFIQWLIKNHWGTKEMELAESAEKAAV